ncbi:SPOC domain-like protein [Dichomitus squalens LYAD-421 SS1]|uniref:ATP-dependent DNA helicase II subunit 2 n=1 Tax=Dichomitus squalens (strain LYAD-421) TaxID=732165 RepID=R7SRI2_DICSQ|nr:SPOC domain-like protein [Dichomitus squalens LYAD-421 SS1]EJF58779.1 SPOC domain-like protein [Dichomitus squalens LYAD-421 SS1]
MFLVDISPSMGKMREVEVPASSGGESEVIEMTNLEWSLQFVMLKIQEMVCPTRRLVTQIFNGRKTDKCGVILFGSEETNNMINDANGGYEHVAEYIPIAQPNSATLAKLAALEPSTVSGDPIDALIVAIETQDQYLGNKKTWTRKVVILTDGESPIEVEDWEATVNKMNALDISLTVVGVDFDDDDLPFHEEDKSNIKQKNEAFYRTFTSKLHAGVVGNCDYALQEISRPDVRQVKSTLMGTVLRIGDTQVRPEEAIEISVKTSKCTALARPKSWKRFGRRKPLAAGKDKEKHKDAMDEDEQTMTFVQLRMRTAYYLEQNKGSKAEEKKEKDDLKNLVKVQKEELVRGYKYGATFLPVADGGYPRLHTRKGIDICGFFQKKNFRRELEMGEVYYVWADPANPMQQVALSSIVQAMYEKGVMAIARWVSKDDMDPKMGVLYPSVFEEVDCLLWVQVCGSLNAMPFADDIRNFPFASLETLINKKGEVVTEHPYLPTNEQMDAMEQFVDAMDLSDAGEKDEEGNREPWFDTRLSYNPAIHRTKQALFHSAIVQDLNTHPLPPPHPELLKYMDPPRRVLKRARTAIEECKKTLKVREVPKKVARVRKDEHVRAPDEDEDMLLLDQKPARGSPSSKKNTEARSQYGSQTQTQTSPSRTQKKAAAMDVGSSETEEEAEELLLDKQTPARKPDRDRGPLPTPARMPGRIIGLSFPLEDFKKNISRGDVVTKAVEDLAWVIQEILTRPFSTRRYDELIECMQELRKVSLEEDEIEAWNTFIQDLRETCLEKEPGNKAFWDKVRQVGRPLSFISSPEASKAGGKSAMPESEAQKVCFLWIILAATFSI